jgi:DNA-binding response OmpR family regulator
MSTQKKRIVLVDDDDDFSAAVTAFLELHGYEVHRATGGRAGLALAKQVHPDLVIMDVMMDERTDGFFAVQNLRRMPGLEQVPVFVVSSIYSVAKDFRVTEDRGWLAHDKFFTKPVDLKALLKAITARIGGDGKSALPKPGTTK